MWVTQTYLGTPDPEADVFVYYLYLNYVDEQKIFTDKLQRELETLGDVFGGKVSLQMPSSRYAGKVEAEVRENKALWEAVYSELPGLLVSTVPLAEISPVGWVDGSIVNPTNAGILGMLGCHVAVVNPSLTRRCSCVGP
jgi:hypothetical protein